MPEESLYCANHPARETALRCNRCEKPICIECAVQTPVGYRCRECVRGQQRKFETARWADLLVAFVLTGIGVGVAVGLLRLIGFWGFFVAPAIGGGMAELIRRAVGRRRSRRMALVAVLGGAVGVLLHLWGPMVGLFLVLSGSANPSLLAGVGFSALYPIAYGVLMLSTFYYRLGGISL